jgi:hypothetical protein
LTVGMKITENLTKLTLTLDWVVFVGAEFEGNWRPFVTFLFPELTVFSFAFHVFPKILNRIFYSYCVCWIALSVLNYSP